MSQAIATTKFIRTSARKLRLVADAVRGMEAEAALQHLKFTPKRANEPLSKAIKQALANAKQLGLSSPLKITHLAIDKGPIYKRIRPVSRGQAHSIQKHTAHIKVILTSQKTTTPSQPVTNQVASRLKSVVSRKPTSKSSQKPKPASTKPVKKVTTSKKTTRSSHPKAPRTKPKSKT